MQGLDGVKELYTQSIERFGASSHGVLWRNEIEQIRRFDLLVDLLDLDMRTPISVNDFGCGYGAFFDFCLSRQIPLSHYYGYDILPQMLEVAKTYVDIQKYPYAEFILADYPIHEADYTVISGTFNLRDRIDVKKWKEYVCERLLLAFSSSKKGLVFNGLSLEKDFKDDGLFYCAKEEFLEFCEYALNARVKSHEDRVLQEWNIALFK